MREIQDMFMDYDPTLPLDWQEIDKEWDEPTEPEWEHPYER